MTAPARGFAPRLPNATRHLLVLTLLALFAMQVIFTSHQMRYPPVDVIGYAFYVFRVS